MSAQTPHKLFIQMSGAPGSGKSTMARLLGHSVGGVVIDHDVLRSNLLESNVPFNQAAKKAYQLQWTLAEDLMNQGLNVIMDSTCNFQDFLDQGSALAKQHGYTHWYVECRVQDIDLLDQRLRARDPMTSQRTAVDRPPLPLLPMVLVQAKTLVLSSRGGLRILAAQKTILSLWTRRETRRCSATVS